MAYWEENHKSGKMKHNSTLGFAAAKNHFFKLFLLLFLCSGFRSMAQCPGCVIDMGCTVSPAAPTLCPANLPDGTQNQAYAEDLTFYMPAQFNTQGVNVTLNQITVLSVTGLPQGISWETSASPANIFYPSQNPPATERGCVRMCGTPTVFGAFNIIVNVSAEVSTPIGNITQQQGFSLSINILPPAGSNSAFAYNPSVGCEPLDVAYSPLIFPQGFQAVTYEWDFGNGNTFYGENPPLQNYLTAGTYYPTLITRVYNYAVVSLSATVTGTNWCADFEEPDLPILGCQGDPDVFFDWTNNSATQSVGSISDNNQPSFTGLNLVLTDPLLSLTFWDEDVISANDNLGTTVLNITGVGNYSFSTTQLFGSLTVDTLLSQTYQVTDTLTVYGTPSIPLITANGPLSFCANQPTSLVVASAGNAVQWLMNDTSLVIGQTQDTLVPVVSGDYAALLTNNFGCSAVSANATVEVFPLPPVPVIMLNGGILSTSATGNLQWYLNGVSLTGETSNTLVYGDSGLYSVRVTDGNGCTAQAYLPVLVPSGIEKLNQNPNWTIFGNPGYDGLLRIQFEGIYGQKSHLEILDLQGRRVYFENLPPNLNGMMSFETHLPSGCYQIKIAGPDFSGIKKWASY